MWFNRAVMWPGAVKRFVGTAGAPARHEREARKWIETAACKNLRAFGALRAGAPAVPANHLTVLNRSLDRSSVTKFDLQLRLA